MPFYGESYGGTRLMYYWIGFTFYITKVPDPPAPSRTCGLAKLCVFEFGVGTNVYGSVSLWFSSILKFLTAFVTVISLAILIGPIGLKGQIADGDCWDIPPVAWVNLAVP